MHVRSRWRGDVHRQAWRVRRQAHAGHCQSFEPEPGLSGLGELVGEAIVEHNADHVEIRTDFPFSRVSGKAMPRGEANGEPPAVNASRKRMSLRAVLHFLYHRAGLNRWYPAMEGRRSQGVIKKYLELAAAGVTLKGETLDKRLYVPEPFRVADKEEIGERRRRKLAMLLSPGDDVAYKMAIVIGQFNGVEQSAYGRKLMVKHMPDVPLYMENKAWERAERAYAATLQARDADLERKPMIVMAALIYAKREHLYQVDSLSMTLVSDQWIPLAGRGTAAAGPCLLEAAALRRQEWCLLPERTAARHRRRAVPAACGECLS